MEHVAHGVADDLHFDVTRRDAGNAPRTPRPSRTRRPLRVGPPRPPQPARRPARHETHAPAAAAGRRLDQQGVADLRRGPLQLLRGRCRRPPRHRAAPGTPAGGDRLLRPRLVAHGAHRLGRRPHPDDPGRGAGLGQARVLGEKAVAWVQRVGLSPPGQFHQRVGVQVGLRRRPTGQRHARGRLRRRRARRSSSAVNTATASRPRSCAPRMMRRAISPRLATRILRSRTAAISAAPPRRWPCPGPGPSGRRSGRWPAPCVCPAGR